MSLAWSETYWSYTRSQRDLAFTRLHEQAVFDYLAAKSHADAARVRLAKLEAELAARQATPRRRVTRAFLARIGKVRRSMSLAHAAMEVKLNAIPRRGIR